MIKIWGLFKDQDRGVICEGVVVLLGPARVVLELFEYHLIVHFRGITDIVKGASSVGADTARVVNLTLV